LAFLNGSKEGAEQFASCGNQQSGPHGGTVYHRALSIDYVCLLSFQLNEKDSIRKH
jgi:hypothetical protein